MRRFHLKRWQIAIGATALVVLVAASIAMGISMKTGGPITAVRAVESSAPETTMSSTFVDLPGALTQPVSVAAGRTALMLVRFSAESECNGGTPSTVCNVRILLVPTGGSPRRALPADDTFVFDQDTGNDGSEGHSMDRWLVVGAGTWRARVQVQVAGPVGTTTTFTLDDWSLILERSDRG
jgi:hypothetical protein